MTQMTAQLLDKALLLPDSERAELATQLIDSLDPESDDGVDEAWDIEIRERIAALNSGAVTPVPWTEARRQIQEEGDDDAS